jgi:DNA polymerase-4
MFYGSNSSDCLIRAQRQVGSVGMEAMATILHADLDAFYASVEQMLDPSMRGKPVAVGGGVVLAASYEAKAFGVRGGMPGRKARELCPQLIFVSGHFKDYQRLGDAAIRVLGDFTPLVERISIDEAFADVAGTEHLFGPPAEIAEATDVLVAVAANDRVMPRHVRAGR